MQAGINAHDIARIANKLVGTDTALIHAAVDVLGSPASVDGAALGLIETRLLTDHSLFRCSSCGRWLPTTRIDPDKEEWCYECGALARGNAEAGRRVHWGVLFLLGVGFILGIGAAWAWTWCFGG